MMVEKHTGLFTKGKYGTPVGVTVITYPGDSLVATAEDEHLTEYQFVDAVQKAYPDYEVVSGGHDNGIWRARGGKVR